MSSVTKSARKNHGPCATCGEDIVPGQAFRTFTAHATQAERDDPDVATFSRRGLGPSVGLKRHLDCPFPEDRKSIRGRRLPGTEPEGMRAARAALSKDEPVLHSVARVRANSGRIASLAHYVWMINHAEHVSPWARLYYARGAMCGFKAKRGWQDRSARNGEQTCGECAARYQRLAEQHRPTIRDLVTLEPVDDEQDAAG